MAGPTKTIRFTETRVVQDEHAGTPEETKFEQGQEYTMPYRSAEHWLKRQVAVEVEKPARPTTPTDGADNPPSSSQAAAVSPKTSAKSSGGRKEPAASGSSSSTTATSE